MPFMDHMSGTDRRLSCLIVNMISTEDVCIMPFMDHMSGTDRRLSYSQHDKYRYVSCHSWITCQEPTEDCLLVNMISTGMYHAIHGSHVRNRQKIVL